MNIIFFAFLGNCSQLTIENSQILDRNNGKLVISCNEGYYPIGQMKISCSDGLLNGTLPSCVRGTYEDET